MRNAKTTKPLVTRGHPRVTNLIIRATGSRGTSRRFGTPNSINLYLDVGPPRIEAAFAADWTIGGRITSLGRALNEELTCNWLIPCQLC
jgi:hypothetical protein